jgi:hypothetical protein
MASQLSLNNLDFSRPLSMHEEWWFDKAVNHLKRLLDAIPRQLSYILLGLACLAKMKDMLWMLSIMDTIYTQPALIEYQFGRHCPVTCS